MTGYYTHGQMKYTDNNVVISSFNFEHAWCFSQLWSSLYFHIACTCFPGVSHNKQQKFVEIYSIFETIVFLLCYGILCCYVVMLLCCYVVMLLCCYVMLCYVMLCYVMLCYVMLCYVMLCYAMLCVLQLLVITLLSS